ncbi:protein ENHANCED DISEASE RESISTANCE 4 [Punica granatum]|uniref:Protein ENHANCED DISEASE RESISTANCE 4 n=3 Tax=Punica granatum TaxID=22663 RepID=A0A6P8E6Y9_PUNGR|nr:protein ENHANCED DISEASE RESISTANCE 4 [Punica granatum]
MTETGKMRLVRCPKCENVLPELENYSVYQCGGCGAVLRANNQNLESSSPLEQSAEVRNTTVLEESEKVHLCDAADVEVKSSVSLLNCDGKVPEMNGLARHENGTGELEGSPETQDIGTGHKPDAKETGMSGENGDHSSQVGSLSSPHMSQPLFDRRATETRANMAQFQDQNLRNNVHKARFSTSQYPHEVPSCPKPRSFSYSQELPSQRPLGLDREKRVQFLEDDRAELLRKLDELKDQLTRSCDVAADPREKAPSVRRTFSSDTYDGPNTWVPNACPSSNGPSKQFLGHETHASPNVSRYQEFFPRNPNPFPAYHGPSSSRVLRTAPGQCHQPQCHPYDRRPDLCDDAEACKPFPRREILHQPSCSCFHGCGKQHEIFLPLQSEAFSKNQFLDVTKNNFFPPAENSSLFGSHYHNMRSAVPLRTLNSHEPQRQIRLPSGLNSRMRGSFGHLPPRGMAMASNSRRERPIAGGAPIITCCNCFELLQLPNKVMRTPKIQQKIQCGACSAVISFKIVGRKLVLPFHEEARTAEEAEGFIHSRSRINRGTANFSSDDFDNSGYEFHAMDRLPVKSSANNLSQSNSQETESLPSSSPSITNDENNPIDTNSLQRPFRPAHSPPPPGSPLQEHFDFSSNNQTGNRFGKGNRSSRSDHEKALPSKTTMRQNSLNEASLVTELDVSYNDYSNTGCSQDSGYGSKEDDQPQVTKGNGESFLANFIKKSFKDLARSNQASGHGKTSVSINGHPVPARVVKKAEKFAGPIHPGNYWYDSRAGFWGAMGGPCLGIIPPNIEEFNYPMLDNCAGGNTGVFVNGRELHKQDLDLLATRGLPTDSNRSYLIEVSGRVWDEDTGEELDCLGKLAPTVEKVKHGFGMKVPRAAAQ